MVKNASLDYELIISEDQWKILNSHLFPGDHDEHGAVITASVAESERGVRLLVRDVFLAVDGVDYVPSPRGYRMLTANFVRDQALYCRDEKLAYLAVHNHGGHNSVAFSSDDLRSHERGYPALKDITRGQIVGGLVLAKNAIAGDLWISNERVPLKRARIIGKNIFEIFPSPPKHVAQNLEIYDRQARVFGERGQAILKNQKVAVVGLGGIGSLVCEYLARLGVGWLVLVDHDKIEWTNIPRVVGSVGCKDSWLSKLIYKIFKWSFGDVGRLKVDVASREARKANSDIRITKYAANVVDEEVAKDLSTCDFIFLAADTMQARLVFNAIVHQFLIPGYQLGSKVSVSKRCGKVEKVFSTIRPVLPGKGCLWCNGLITPDGLQSEALSESERQNQRYVEDENIPSPSVITLNAVSASHAVNDYLFRLTGLRSEKATDDYVYIEPRTNIFRFDMPRSDEDCSECSTAKGGRYARGASRNLPTLNKSKEKPKSFLEKAVASLRSLVRKLNIE